MKVLQVLRLPRKKNEREVLQVLPLPRKTRLRWLRLPCKTRRHPKASLVAKLPPTSMKVLQVLRLPRKNEPEMLQVLRLPRKNEPEML